MKQVDVGAAPQAVWRILADFGGVASWAPAVREARCTTEQTSGVGCRRSVTASDGTIVEEVVTRWDEGRSLTFEVPGGLARLIGFLEETWSVEEAPGGAIINVLMEYRTRLGPLGAVVARLIVGPALARMLSENLAGLKRHVEAGQWPVRSARL